ncbi:MAG: hypothetical protein P8N76_11345 [Pirellulaceae bacterium]|nr:hypothetical protein [Pirellulaceae bacterium]
MAIPQPVALAKDGRFDYLLIKSTGIYDSLQECLLTDKEFSAGIEAWKRFQDPFPRWNLNVDEALSART